MARIILENMEFHAFHGVLEHEKTLGNTFLVTLDMEVNTEKAGMSDHLESAIAEGATVVRVGSAIFGTRTTPDSHGVSQ